MKPQDIIKVIAELDGRSDLWLISKHGLYYRPDAHGYTNSVDEAWKVTREEAKKHEYLHGDEPVTIGLAPHKQYITSRDAIVPVIEKQDSATQLKYIYWLRQIVARKLEYEPKEVDTCDLVLADADSHCEALLRATGKWKD